MERLEQCEPRQIHVSAITIFEFEAGLFDGSPNIRQRRAMWQRFQGLITYELVTDSIASGGAGIVRATAKAGKQIGALDALIAATALEWDFTLATRDSDYDRVKGLRVEHWR